MTDTTRPIVFVFGSNVAGRHGKGAALTARLHYGAVMGVGEGPMGRCYALPTQWTPWKLMALEEIAPRVQNFLDCARRNPQYDFQVTQVGCGLAGHQKEDIAPMFQSATDNCFFDTAWAPFLPQDTRFWGHF